MKVLTRWKTRLLNDPQAIDDIERAIKRWRAGASRSVAKARSSGADLHWQSQDGDELRRRKSQVHPIGSGHVEACSKLVQMRRKGRGEVDFDASESGDVSEVGAGDAGADTELFRRRIEPVAQAE